MKKLIIFYDNWCPNCTKFSKIVRQFDWLNLLEIKPLRPELHLKSFSDIDLQLAQQQMASYGNRWHYGYNSLYYIFARLPLFWIFIPIFFILKITKTGQFIYKELAIRRKIIPIHCDKTSCKI